jgi:hypothetical protein
MLPYKPSMTHLTPPPFDPHLKLKSSSSLLAASLAPNTRLGLELADEPGIHPALIAAAVPFGAGGGSELPPNRSSIPQQEACRYPWGGGESHAVLSTSGA